MAMPWGGGGGGWGGRMPAQPAQPPWTQSGVPGLISSGGGGAGSTAGQGAGVNNVYDKTGNLSSILSREGIDIGPQPDFFGDLNQIVSRLRPVPTAALQAGALRDRTAAAPVSAPVQYERPMRTPAPQRSPYEGWTGRNFGHPSMSPQGVMGTYVNPLDVPIELQGTVPTGYFADNALSNYTYSPLVNQAYYHTGQLQREKPR